MTCELGKKARSSAKRSDQTDLQALQEQFSAQLKSSGKMPQLEKSQRKKKQQKATEPGRVTTTGATNNEPSGSSVGHGGVVDVVLPSDPLSLALVEGQDVRPILVLA